MLIDRWEWVVKCEMNNYKMRWTPGSDQPEDERNNSEAN